MIKYDKLFERLKQYGYNFTVIRKEGIISESTLTAIRTGKGGLSHKNIDKLCRLLECQPNDIMEYVKDQDANND